MRLSTAMMLGSTTCKMIPMDLNSCAIGAALNAMGVKKLPARGAGMERVEEIKRIWPWLVAGFGLSQACQEIFRRFDGPVCNGEMTFEELVDYVRSIEPDCDCNEFDCACAFHQESISIPEEVTVQP